MTPDFATIPARLKEKTQLQTIAWQNNRRLGQITRQVTANAKLDPARRPVIFFNATTRLSGISQNAAFAFLTSSGLQLAGQPVVHFACRAGLSRCVLATDRDDPSKEPPCRACIAQSGWLFANAPVVWFSQAAQKGLEQAVSGLGVEVLSELVYEGVPLGRLAVPSLRWALRRHHFVDDESTRFLLRQYVLSAYRVSGEFAALVEQVEPEAVVVFNGMMYPEAAARWAAMQRGVRVITHEVGLQPFTCFFTGGEATAYPIDIPPGFELSEAQNSRLDAYLEQRFQGKFSMAGVRFWPEMTQLDPALVERIERYQQMVPVFTNVIFDTSQGHANTVFPHMFAWLDDVLDLVKAHPETLFIIRAHPDEMRPGKESRESVQGWVESRGVLNLTNVLFIPSNEYVSSYELVRRAKFVMVYNSSIGLEASLMGAAVLSGGKARYTQLPTVFFPQTQAEYRAQAQEFLVQPVERVEPRPEFAANARRFLYFQLYRTSLPYGEFLAPHPWPGFVRLRSFPWQALTPEKSPAIKVVLEGIQQNKPFLLDD